MTHQVTKPHCSYCGRQINDDHNFCPYCGERALKRPEPLSCEHCNRKLEPTDSICPGCERLVPWGLRCSCYAIFRELDQFCWSCGRAKPKRS